MLKSSTKNSIGAAPDKHLLVFPSLFSWGFLDALPSGVGWSRHRGEGPMSSLRIQNLWMQPGVDYRNTRMPSGPSDRFMWRALSDLGSESPLGSMARRAFLKIS